MHSLQLAKNCKVYYAHETKVNRTHHQKAASTNTPALTIKYTISAFQDSGLRTSHMEHCKAKIEGPEILHTADDRNKNPKYDLRVREALLIRRYNAGPGRGMNEDMGSYVQTNQWQPVFNKMGAEGGGARESSPSV